MSLLRDAGPDDLDAILDVQQEGSVRALSHIFPQDRFPFPRAELAQRWAAEIADPAVRVLVIHSASHDGVAGFAALRADQLLHLGTAVSTWGTGLASAAHAEIIALLPGDPWLWVFTGNHRARRFYGKHGWQPTGRTCPTVFAPHPELMEYRYVPFLQEAT
ncbi:MAG TPA: GNAT family protein [Actinoplanes sp.]|nr:GNAT family protein [Actinoplanes sp.]